MTQPGVWYSAISQNVEGIRAGLEASEVKELHLDKLVKLARHIDSFSECADCLNHKLEIEKLVADLRSASRMNKEQRRSYWGRMERMVSHLQKKHKLISEGQNLAIWLSIGTALGLVLGGIFHNSALGIPIGVALGVGVGIALDARAKSEGRVI
jgi:hypothetical protein